MFDNCEIMAGPGSDYCVANIMLLCFGVCISFVSKSGLGFGEDFPKAYIDNT